jgi:uncharacterized protein YbbC (DUF1343 family)/CubicO group peptidase (beta-lactamase class C family)
MPRLFGRWFLPAAIAVGALVTIAAPLAPDAALAAQRPASPAPPATAEPSSHARGPSAEADWAGVDAAIRDAVAAGDVPGAVVLIGRRDQVVYRRAFGARALVPVREPLTAETVFDLASLTKVVATAPAVLWLVERGRVELDAPIGRYLDELRTPALQDVTIRRLLLHDSGLPDVPPRDAVGRGFPEAGRLIAAAGLTIPSGSGFIYSDTGFILLGELVRRVSGEPLDRFLQKRFYGPLGMRNTAFHPPESWRTRIAPTEAVDGGPPLRGVVHDRNARLLAGVAGHAGLFATADDLGRFCRMLLRGGELDGRRYLAEATVRAMLTPVTIGEVTRGLGWDMASPFSRTLGPYLPMGSGGHTGFTGPAMWLDPATGVWLVLLTNRVHPHGKGSVVEIRRRVSGAVAARLVPLGSPPPLALLEDPGGPAADPPSPPAGPTRTGLDVLAAEGFARLQGRRVGLVTNQTGVDAQGRRGVDLLAGAPGVKLVALFAPEHGLAGQADTKVPHERDAATGLPVWSLYGAERRPTTEMLAGVDTLVFDVQDVGVRYYTYLTTLVYLLEEGERRRLPVVVLDRPNPITGRIVEGPVMDPDLRSFTAPHPIAVRSGLTIGEFARMVTAERRLRVDLTVVPLENWSRSRWFEETGLPWVNPSPNIRAPRQALLYAGIGLLEQTNVSVGRGTPWPFEVVGAPWITRPRDVADALNARGLAGVRFEAVSFTPTGSVHAGQTVGGVRLVVTDRDVVRPIAVALTLARELHARHVEFRPAAIQNLLVSRAPFWAFLRGDPVSAVLGWAEATRPSYMARRATYLLYR